VRRRLRWGIVRTGGISRTTVGDLHLAENVDLVAVASRTAAAAEAFATTGSCARSPSSWPRTRP